MDAGAPTGPCWMVGCVIGVCDVEVEVDVAGAVVGAAVVGAAGAAPGTVAVGGTAGGIVVL